MAVGNGENRLEQALIELGARQHEIAHLCGLSRGRVSLLVNGHLPETPRTTEQKRSICRQGLMVQAVLLGLPDDEVWRYGEHEIFGLPECDRQLVLGEVRAQAERIRAARMEQSAARDGRPPQEVPA